MACANNDRASDYERMDGQVVIDPVEDERKYAMISVHPLILELLLLDLAKDIFNKHLFRHGIRIDWYKKEEKLCYHGNANPHILKAVLHEQFMCVVFSKSNPFTECPGFKLLLNIHHRGKILLYQTVENSMYVASTKKIIFQFMNAEKDCLAKQLNRELDVDTVIASIKHVLDTADDKKDKTLIIPLRLSDIFVEETFLLYFCDVIRHKPPQYVKTIYLVPDDPTKKFTLMKILTTGLPTCKFYNLIPMEDSEGCGDIWINDICEEALLPGTSNVELDKGDLVDQQVDVIVNSTNTELNLEKGAVSSKILEKAGHSIANECRNTFPKGVEFGTVIKTSGGNLYCGNIYHFALPKWTPNAQFPLQILSTSIFKCLLMASMDKQRTIAFPVFGTGILEYPWHAVADTMLTAIKLFYKIYTDSSLKVKIVLFQKDTKSIEAFHVRQNVKTSVYLVPEDQRDTRDIKTEEPQNNRLSWNIIVRSDNTTRGLKNALTKAFEFAAKERLLSIAVQLLQDEDSPTCKEQFDIVKNIITDKTSHYLQVIKLIVLKSNEQKFYDMEKREKGKKGDSKFKQTCYTVDTDKPKLILTVEAKGDDRKQVFNKVERSLSENLGKL